MKTLILSLFITALSVGFALGQHKFNGKVLDAKSNEPLVGANIIWQGTTKGTISAADGRFSIDALPDAHMLVVSFVGYRSAVVHAHNDEAHGGHAEQGAKKNGPHKAEEHDEHSGDDSELLLVKLVPDQQLDEVTVTERTGGSTQSKLTTIQTTQINQAGLQRLPCCNLSESFENDASVDVNYTDAVTGAKQIKMLGLAGIYTQILRENIPSLRGLASSYGLSYIPGTWLESIQISKGAASVINGYESTTGQINIELQKPEKSDRLFVNLFGNQEGRMESNVHATTSVNQKWSTMVLAHASQMQTENDHNKDGFLDVPLGRQLNLINRWKYFGSNGFESQFGANVMVDERDGGQVAGAEQLPGNPRYTTGTDTKRYELFAKIGFPFGDQEMGHSIGSTYSLGRHEQTSLFGANNYTATQQSAYANIIYNQIPHQSHYSINAGASFLLDDYDELLNGTVMKRTEYIPGVFAQYGFKNEESFNLNLGLRADWNSHYGLFITPRAHLKYNFAHEAILRLSAGKGYRSPSVIAENLGLLATSRVLNLADDLSYEEAWNLGASLSKEWHIGRGKELELVLDYYHTRFENQVVVDVVSDPYMASFYMLDGRSYSHSVQAQVSTEPIDRFTVLAAVRYNDVRTTMKGSLQEKPLTKRTKALLSLSYASKHEKWQFDLTNQYNGRSRLPDLGDKLPVSEQRKFSPDFFVVHAQVTRRFGLLEVYVGGENLTNYKQQNPIISAENPFDDAFDSSVIWGPITGTTVYAGLRFKLK